MVNLTIDNINVSVPEGTTIMDALPKWRISRFQSSAI